MEKLGYADSDFESDPGMMLETALDLDDLEQQAEAAEREGDEFEADLHRLAAHAAPAAGTPPASPAKKTFTPRRNCRYRFR